MSDNTSFSLPTTRQLLASGGDYRIVPDADSGLTVYGCGHQPDTELLSFGSSTASTVSETGFLAAEQLRQLCQHQLISKQPQVVYQEQMDRLRQELLTHCRLNDLGVQVLAAASGTDIHLLAAQWLQPACTVMINKVETGSSIPLALRGEHFNQRSVFADQLRIGAPVSQWHGEVHMIDARTASGALRDAASIDKEYAAYVDQQASQGKRVLTVLTDVSKTGLIFPSLAIVLALKQKWPEHIEVFVDACQFRLSVATVKAYVMHDFMLALTGSKFLTGPTFSGMLLIPPGVAQRFRHAELHKQVQDYSCAQDWPMDFFAHHALHHQTNFGLLLRWEAAMAELRCMLTIPNQAITDFLQEFKAAIKERLLNDPVLEALPVRELDRSALMHQQNWDQEQTIFSFLLHHTAPNHQRRPLNSTETHHVYRALMIGNTKTGRLQLGQPVQCGQRDGVAVSALRLSVSTRMIVRACQTDGTKQVIAEALSAFDQVRDAIAAEYPCRDSHLI
ncbi:hypothetical protein LPB67_07375 [Undibacterium sp. Jales W-56]|uniref:hypothetical protein n=1 Tax=Undibacterium sp. Jales W-56 TaxID=2897325 RepID=UPI0021D2BA3F|nr:hypothetical protein [Undibacterium sp. Jales W-56]MCU6433596.1 hypothetical protein [Undibacterium sp. Jales W-56]